LALAGCRPGNGTSHSASHAAAAAPGGDVVAAEVGGERITVSEVDRKAAGSLERIRS
jgi:hypothetical protein